MSRNKQNSPSTNRLHIHIRSISNGFFDGLNVSVAVAQSAHDLLVGVLVFCRRFWFKLRTGSTVSFLVQERLLRLTTPHSTTLRLL